MGKLNWLFMLLLVGVIFSLINCTEGSDDIKVIKDTTSVKISKNDSTYIDSASVPNDNIKIVPGDSSIVIDTTLTRTDNDDVTTTPNDSLIEKDSIVTNTDPVVVPPHQKIKSINIIFDGDSQTKRGYYPAKLVELLKLKGYSPVSSTITAVAGQYISQLISDVSTEIVPKYNGKYDINVVCLWIGGNDATKDAKTDTARLYKQLRSYYFALNKAGFKILLINLPDANRHIGTNIMNAMYVRNQTLLSDVFVNCREKGGVFEDVTNTTYYSDESGHLSVKGYQIMAERYVYPKFLELLNK